MMMGGQPTTLRRKPRILQLRWYTKSSLASISLMQATKIWKASTTPQNESEAKNDKYTRRQGVNC